MVLVPRKRHSRNNANLAAIARMPLATVQQLADNSSTAELAVLDGVTPGTVGASKAVVVDSSKDVSGLRNVTQIGPTGTGSSSASVLNLQTAETTVVALDQLGRIDFKAPSEASGSDALLVAASIYAEAEATFDATTNTCAIVLATGTSEAAVEWTRLTGAGVLKHVGSLATGPNATDRATIKGIYMNPSVISVAVPTIADNAAENVDRVDVDVSAAFSIQPAVGDAVIAIPAAALPTDCVLCGAYVSATDHIIVSFGSIEGGGGVTGASVNFNFLVFDLT